ncbi:hypothetical protein GCM10007913_30480 [Devosia yakushimensis]|uniref:Uncharacterized protein n=1 Tax=Devosia yakushimensis TaxID=470028 RepID=A0ABQ5UGL2_9HYPH|nr:hypothetical protein GCM10007913_30480 [Devosia yakushimensis]
MRAALQRRVSGSQPGEWGSRSAPGRADEAIGRELRQTLGPAIAPSEKVPAPRGGVRLILITFEANAVSGSVRLFENRGTGGASPWASPLAASVMAPPAR